jgi:hypothetical protein
MMMTFGGPFRAGFFPQETRNTAEAQRIRKKETAFFKDVPFSWKPRGRSRRHIHTPKNHR